MGGERGVEEEKRETGERKERNGNGLALGSGHTTTILLPRPPQHEIFDSFMTTIEDSHCFLYFIPL